MSSTGSAEPVALTPRKQLGTLLAVCAGQGMILLDGTIVNVALPAMQRDLGVTPGNLEWVVNAYILALAALILVGGTLGDRFGRKKIFLIGVVIFTLGSIACALSPDDPELIASRALQGIGAAVMAPLTLSILVDAYPPQRRQWAIGIWAAVAGIGFAAGAIVGGLLVAVFSWSAVFWVNVPIGAFALLLTWFSVRESKNPEARKLDPLGVVLVTAGLLVLTYGVIETEVNGWLSWATALTLAIAAVLLGAFFWWESRAGSPLVPLSLLRRPIFSAASIAYGIAYGALSGLFFLFSLYLQNVRGYSALDTGFAWLTMNIPFLLVSMKAGRLAKLLHGHAPWVGLAGAAVGTAWLGTFGVHTPIGWAVPALVVVGAGFGLVATTLPAVAMTAFQGVGGGVASGVLTTARQVATAVGLAILGSISVARASASWQSTPVGAGHSGKAVLAQVGGAEIGPLSHQFGPAAGEAASQAFSHGMQAALLTAGALMLLGSVVAFRRLRLPVPPAGESGVPPAGAPAVDEPTVGGAGRTR